jgi:hypothetical protein
MKVLDAAWCRQRSSMAGKRTNCLVMAVVLAFWIRGAYGSGSEDPYAVLRARNPFGLVPPTRPTNVQRQGGGLPNIELKGITTILGRPQALLTISGVPNSPEASDGGSFIMEAGQIEDGIKIDDINYDAGVVRLEAKGMEISLRLLDYVPNPVEEPVPTVTSWPSIANRPINRGSDAIAPALPEITRS